MRGGVVIQLPPPPVPALQPVVDNTGNLMDWGILANDRIGDCVVACIGHTIEIWAALATGNRIVIPDAAIIQAYSAISGYNPATGTPDPGMQVPQGLNYWIANGVGGYRLTGFVQIRTSPEMVKHSIASFGVCILAMQVNPAVQQAFAQSQPWLNNYGAANDGHCVPVVAYDETYLECITWGRLQRMNWMFFNNYVTEAYIPFGPEMLRANGLTFSGYNQAQIAILANNILFGGLRV
jgi:hypothetical protein